MNGRRAKAIRGLACVSGTSPEYVINDRGMILHKRGSPRYQLNAIKRVLRRVKI